MKLPSKM